MGWPQWKTVTSFLTTLNRIVKWPRNPTPRYPRKRTENRCLNKTYAWIFIAVLVTPAKRRKPPRCLPMEEWIGRTQSVQMKEYYSVSWILFMKRNEVLTHTPPWTNLQNNMLSERSQTQKAVFCMIPLKRKFQIRQIHRDKKQISVARSWVEGECGAMVIDTRFLLAWWKSSRTKEFNYSRY